MRLLLGLLVALVLGAAVGAATAYVRIQINPWSLDVLSGTAADADRAMQARPPLAKAVIEQTEHDFGTLSLDATGEHEFVVRNTGDAKLTLVAGETSCRCTLSKIGSAEVPPGGETKVLLTFKGVDHPGPYRQTATILTNDPARPRVTLTIVGRITAVARAAPAELVLSQVSAEVPSRGEVRVFGYVDEPLRITGWTLVDRQTADRFEVSAEPLPPDQLRDEPTARSGMLLTVTTKPGLPQGEFQQTIRLATNLPGAGTIEVPIRGTVTSDIGVAGRGWESSRSMLVFGAVSQRTGAQRRLSLIVRGPHRQQVHFAVTRVVPESLKVTLGEPNPIGEGAAWQTPMTVEVPPGSPTCNHLGSDLGPLGEIHLKTGHPDVPELKLLVYLAVEQ